MKTWSKFTLGLRMHIGESSHSSNLWAGLWECCGRQQGAISRQGFARDVLKGFLPQNLHETGRKGKTPYVWREWEPALWSAILTLVFSWVVQWRRGVELEGVGLGIQARQWRAASRVTSAFVGLLRDDQRIVMREVYFFLFFWDILLVIFSD